MNTNHLLLLTALVVAIVTGIFFTWSNAVTPGLGKLGDKEYLLAFQSMNREIQNPLFFLVFFGAALLLPLCLFLFLKQNTGVNFLIAATLLYWIGVMAVTIFGNVPLNQLVESTDITNSSVLELERVRLAFENKWNLYNLIRSVCSVGSLLCVLVFCIFRTK